MSAPMSIFLEPGVDPDTTVRELQRALGVELRRDGSGSSVRFEHDGVGYSLVVFRDHGLEDDHGIPFTQYSCECDLLVSYDEVDPELAHSFRDALGLYTFSRITQALRWRAMLVDNLQRVVLSFSP
jgi:hypothetical protein